MRVIAPGKSIPPPGSPAKLFISFLYLPFFFPPLVRLKGLFHDDISSAFVLKPSWEAPSQLFSPSARSIYPFFCPFLLTCQHSHLSLYFLLLISDFVAKRKTPFTLLSPSATFASSTNLSRDSSEAQSQSRYRSATSFKNCKHLLLSSNHLLFDSLQYSATHQLKDASSLQSTNLLHQDNFKTAHQAPATMFINGTDPIDGGGNNHWVQEFWVCAFVAWICINVFLILFLWPIRDWSDLL